MSVYGKKVFTPNHVSTDGIDMMKPAEDMPTTREVVYPFDKLYSGRDLMAHTSCGITAYGLKITTPDSVGYGARVRHKNTKTIPRLPEGELKTLAIIGTPNKDLYIAMSTEDKVYIFGIRRAGRFISDPVPLAVLQIPVPAAAIIDITGDRPRMLVVLADARVVPVFIISAVHEMEKGSVLTLNADQTIGDGNTGMTVVHASASGVTTVLGHAGHYVTATTTTGVLAAFVPLNGQVPTLSSLIKGDKFRCAAPICPPAAAHAAIITVESQGKATDVSMFSMQQGTRERVVIDQVAADLVTFKSTLPPKPRILVKNDVVLFTDGVSPRFIVLKVDLQTLTFAQHTAMNVIGSTELPVLCFDITSLDPSAETKATVVWSDGAVLPEWSAGIQVLTAESILQYGVSFSDARAVGKGPHHPTQTQPAAAAAGQGGPKVGLRPQSSGRGLADVFSAIRTPNPMMAMPPTAPMGMVGVPPPVPQSPMHGGVSIQGMTPSTPTHTSSTGALPGTKPFTIKRRDAPASPPVAIKPAQPLPHVQADPTPAPAPAPTPAQEHVNKSRTRKPRTKAKSEPKPEPKSTPVPHVATPNPPQSTVQTQGQPGKPKAGARSMHLTEAQIAKIGAIVAEKLRPSIADIIKGVVAEQFMHIAVPAMERATNVMLKEVKQHIDTTVANAVEDLTEAAAAAPIPTRPEPSVGELANAAAYAGDYPTLIELACTCPAPALDAVARALLSVDPADPDEPESFPQDVAALDMVGVGRLLVRLAVDLSAENAIDWIETIVDWWVLEHNNKLPESSVSGLRGHLKDGPMATRATRKIFNQVTK